MADGSAWVSMASGVAGALVGAIGARLSTVRERSRSETGAARVAEIEDGGRFRRELWARIERMDKQLEHQEADCQAKLDALHAQIEAGAEMRQQMERQLSDSGRQIADLQRKVEVLEAQQAARAA